MLRNRQKLKSIGELPQADYSADLKNFIENFDPNLNNENHLYYKQFEDGIINFVKKTTRLEIDEEMRRAFPKLPPNVNLMFLSLEMLLDDIKTRLLVIEIKASLTKLSNVTYLKIKAEVVGDKLGGKVNGNNVEYFLLPNLICNNGRVLLEAISSSKNLDLKVKKNILKLLSSLGIKEKKDDKPDESANFFRELMKEEEKNNNKKPRKKNKRKKKRKKKKQIKKYSDQDLQQIIELLENMIITCNCSKSLRECVEFLQKGREKFIKQVKRKNISPKVIDCDNEFFGDHENKSIFLIIFATKNPKIQQDLCVMFIARKLNSPYHKDAQKRFLGFFNGLQPNQQALVAKNINSYTKYSFEELQAKMEKATKDVLPKGLNCANK